MTYDEMFKILRRAQQTYGKKNQIMVSIEECSELAGVLSKYSRYPTHEEACMHLRDKVLDELADVGVCIRHIVDIFEFTDEELRERTFQKVRRLEKWLNYSPDMYQTTKDRDVN